MHGGLLLHERLRDASLWARVRSNHGCANLLPYSEPHTSSYSCSDTRTYSCTDARTYSCTDIYSHARAYFSAYA